MAWNKPNSNTVDATSSSRPSGRGKMPRLRKGLLAGVIVVLGAGIAAWFFSNGEATSPSLQKKERGLIKEVTPAAAPKAEPVKKEEEKDPKAPYIVGKRGIPIPTYGFKTYRDERGILRYEGGQRVYDPNRPSESLNTGAPTPQIFKRHSANTIAYLVSHEPGEMLVGEIEVGDDFVNDLKESLSEQILDEQDDTDSIRQLKQAVREVKKDLAQRMASGEDVARLINDTRTDLQNLARYRNEVRQMVEENSKNADGEDIPEVDYKDLISAANLMLSEKGVKELEENEITRWSMIFEAERINDEK